MHTNGRISKLGTITKRNISRIALGSSTQLAWLPVAHFANHSTWFELPSSSLMFIICFLIALSAITCAAFFKSIPLLKKPQLMLFVQAGITLVGCLLAYLASIDEQISAFLLSLSFVLLGGACGLGYVVWEQELLRLPKKHLAWVTVVVLFVFALSFAVSTLMNQIIACLISASAVFVSALSWKDSFLFRGHRDASEKLAEDDYNRLLGRTWLSFCILAFMTSIMLGNILIARRLPSDLLNSEYSVLGVFALIIGLVFSWRKRCGFDFLRTFSICIPFAAIAFFPILPYSIYDSSFTIISREAWMILLSGFVVLVSREVIMVRSRKGRRLNGLALFGLASGYLLGATFYLIVSSTAWFYQLFRVGTGNGLAYILASGILAIMSTFFCMNTLMNKHRFQRKGFPALPSFPPTDTSSMQASEDIADTARPQASASIIDMDERYQNIAKANGLTPREREVLEILAKGNNLARVQEYLFISEGTAITHRRNIYQKLNVHSKQELIDFLWEGVNRPIK